MVDENIALMAHLMRRAGFGANRDELEALTAIGYEQVVEELVDPDKFGIPHIDREILFRAHPDTVNPQAPPGASSYMIYHFMVTQRPLEEKMALFWHTVFATGNNKIDGPPEMQRQYDLFRDMGLGNYRDLLVALAKNPAMIFWLDNNYNHKDQPNENWGRELLELFSMGQGNYTEEDVFECARAFTGWTIGPKLPRGPFNRFNWPFVYNEKDHDDTEKHFLGHRGRFNGEDIIDIVVRQPATARFIARHLYNFFVADEVQVPAWLHTPPKDPVAVNIIADSFVSSGYDMRVTMRQLLNSDFFKEARFQRVKSPAEVVAGVTRMVGDFRYPRPGLEDMARECEYMGQNLLNPPSVEGWHYGPEWIDSGSLVRRINFAAEAFSNIQFPGVRSIIGRIKSQGELSPTEFVDSCLDLIGPIEVGEGTREQLINLAERDGALSWDSETAEAASARRIGDMLALIVSSREYQFA